MTGTRQLTALRASWLFDGEVLRPDPVVLLDGGTVVGVGSAPPGVEVVDLPGATLLPGLVDPHVHLAFDASADPVGALAVRSDAEALAAMVTAARTALLAGITTVRDLGDRDYLALALRGRPDLPTILAAGPPITTPGGHCHFLGGAVPATEQAIRAAVREHAERGCDVVKIMASGGTLTPGSRQEDSQFGVAELRAAVDEAHRLGLPVAAHAHGETAIADAVAAGVDSLEHVSFWTKDGVADRPDLMKAIVAERVIVGATMGREPSMSGLALPPPVLARLPFIVANLRRLVAAGAIVVAGTDAGIGPIKPHSTLRHVLPDLLSIGMSPVDALRTVTSKAAGACGLATTKGRLLPGHDADILVVDGNPLTDPTALTRVRAVYKNGVLVS
jgi:imidazolonepropionase-like amidohydrolase